MRGLKDRGNVARDGATVGLGDVEISQKALACNSRAHQRPDRSRNYEMSKLARLISRFSATIHLTAMIQWQ